SVVSMALSPLSRRRTARPRIDTDPKNSCNSRSMLRFWAWELVRLPRGRGVNERMGAIGELDVDSLQRGGDDLAASELRMVDDVADGERPARGVGQRRLHRRAPGDRQEIGEATQHGLQDPRGSLADPGIAGAQDRDLARRHAERDRLI